VKKPDARQLDLFVAFVGDVPLRDERESMSMPLVALGKRKRFAPINWTSADGMRWCHVEGSAKHGMATVFDMDILIWCASQLNEAVEHGLDTSPTLHFQPYDMLKAIGRDVGGRNYKLLEASLRRLMGTTVETNVRADGHEEKASFHWLEGWTHKVDEATGKSLGMSLVVSNWFYKAVVVERSVLAVDPGYFALTSGLARWLYRLARRHAGHQGAGWRFTLRHLHERSGSTQKYGDFTRDVRKQVAANTLPEYSLTILKGQRGDELVHMWRDSAKLSLPQKRTLQRLG